MSTKILGSIAASCFVILTLSANAEASTIYKKINYYTISGTTPAQLDKALTRKGPYVKNTGMHHPGATTISFKPQLKLIKQGDYCKVADVQVDVYAKMSLPRWKQRSTTKSMEMALIWDTLSRDIKRHEESHIVIARAHASKIERAVRQLPAQTDCDTLRKNIEQTSAQILQSHEDAQRHFDKVEAINFEQRFTNLLITRIKQLKDQTK